ncbi:hypothetical protein P775_08300 [Puniceibacterium antarcticum]|uniref:Uncharacterized protein n=1 Tax=Puniceibacterium antarcticum TaxID=1206336 RepID=A0A2G8RG42_9RHOB|nr:hypothetical protein [Puniceibacterium antarcticum]PIL20520.1 hypothetical protein P775_08300 [Puniceibacterium antarcticum]
MAQQILHDTALDDFQRVMAQFVQADRRPCLPDTRALMTRKLTPDELLGFIYALDCMRTWAAQIDAGAVRLSANPADGEHLSPQAIAHDRAHFAGCLAEAMQLGFLR